MSELRPVIRRSPDGLTRLEALRMACARAGISPQDCRSPDRVTELVFRRYHVMAILREERGYSLPVVGRLVGRTHAAVLRGLRKYPDSVYTWHYRLEEAKPLAIMSRWRMMKKRAAAKAQEVE